MEVYIDKEFLDNFYLDFDDKDIQKKIKKLLINYGSKQVFIECSESDFISMDNENEIFSNILSSGTTMIPVESIKKHLFNKSNFEQTLVFTNKKLDWFKAAENEGAICFSFDDYQARIQIIVDSLHFKIDLSEGFPGWDFASVFKKIKFNKISISDAYILTDNSNNKISKNIIPLLKKLIDFNSNRLNVNVFTKYFNSLQPNEASKNEKICSIYNLFNRTFANSNVKFKIISTDFPQTGFEWHDRYIATNFSITDCGKGFNLMPFTPSDSQIISETIFDYYTYKRLKNLMSYQSKYISKLNRMETLSFKMFP